MKLVERKKNYRSYLLRLWKDDSVEDIGKQGWQISLENPFTGERRRFVTLSDLFKYLELQIQERHEDQIP